MQSAEPRQRSACAWIRLPLPSRAREEDLQRQPTIHEMRLAGNVARFVRRKEERQRRRLLSRSEPAHRLAVDEILLDLGQRLSAALRLCRNPVLERRRLDGAGTDGVAADTAP